jgi:hypothetical protein
MMENLEAIITLLIISKEYLGLSVVLSKKAWLMIHQKLAFLG